MTDEHNRFFLQFIRRSAVRSFATGYESPGQGRKMARHQKNFRFRLPRPRASPTRCSNTRQTAQPGWTWPQPERPTNYNFDAATFFARSGLAQTLQLQTKKRRCPSTVSQGNQGEV